MTRLLQGAFAVLLTSIGVMTVCVRSEGQERSKIATTAHHFPTTAAEFDQMFTQVSNWGRWGKDDERGAANLVTAGRRKAATALVRSGISVSLAHQPITEAAADAAPGELFKHRMRGPGFVGDTYEVSYHGYIQSHIDALCHWTYKGHTYNGYTSSEVNTAKGCMKLGIQSLKDGVVTRGVLIDIPRLKGLTYLEPSTPVYPEDIVAWEKKAGIKISAADAVFLRTGRWARRERLGPWAIAGMAAGFHASVVPLLRTRDVAFVGSDAVADVEPTYIEGYTGMGGRLGAVHTALIAGMGVNLLDHQDLEALAQTAAKLNRWEFMITFAPIPVTGGTGSPINVTATF